MNALPDELKLEILRNLDYNSLTNVCGVNSAFNDLCKDRALWKRLLEKDYGNAPLISLPAGNPYYQSYLYYRSSPSVYVLTSKFGNDLYIDGAYSTFQSAKNQMIKILSTDVMFMEYFAVLFENRHPEYDRQLVGDFFSMSTFDHDDIIEHPQYRRLLTNYLQELPLYLDEIVYITADGTHRYILSDQFSYYIKRLNLNS